MRTASARVCASGRAASAMAAIDPGTACTDENVGDALGLKKRLEHRAGALDVGAHMTIQAGQATGAGRGGCPLPQSALQAGPASQRTAHGGELPTGAPVRTRLMRVGTSRKLVRSSRAQGAR